MAPKREVRMDVGSLRADSVRTPQGFLKVGGNISRVGVLTYVRADGSEFRELRTPSEVFRDDSLRTLEMAPLTDRHPAGLVNTRNVRDLQVGIVTGARKDARFVAGDLVVQDQRMIDKIDRGDARELSAGYTCSIDGTPGEFNGERFDGIQRAIVYNHVALGPRDWGRAGNDVRLHVDGIDADLLPVVGVELRQDDRDRRIPEIETRKNKMDMVTIKIDGLDFEVAKTAAPAIEKAMGERDGKLAAATKRADEAEGKLDAVTKERDETKVKLDEANSPETLATRVKGRVALEKSAAKVLGSEVNFDGKADQDIRLEVLKKHDEKFNAEGRSEDYITARFDAIVEAAPERNDGVEKVRKALNPPRDVQPRLDANGDEIIRIDSAHAAQRNAVRNAQDLSKKPLRVSIDK